MTTFLVLWLCGQAAGVALVWMFAIGLGQRVTTDIAPPVAVIVAVKGHGDTFDEFLVRLFEQDYPRFRAIFAIESADDPAMAILDKCRALAPDRVTLVLAGEAIGEGQKTANLLAAVSHLRHDDEILVFADADILPEHDWLSRLVEPLVRRSADIVTGFPWPVVKDGQFASLMLASIAAMAATLPRLPFFNGAWGGSTAIRHEDFRALDMNRQWRGALSDDLQLTNVAVRAGLRIVAPADVLLRTPVAGAGFVAAIARTRRWYMLARLHIPVVHGVALALMTFAALGWVMVLLGALMWRADALIVLLLALGLAGLRTLVRRRIVARLWGRDGLARNRLLLLADWAVAPFAIVMSAACGWSAISMKRTTWAGITYEVRGPRNVEVLTRG
jgi:ceramide glucosyltransferase